MGLDLNQTQAVSEMAGLLYDFLPGSGSPAWRGHVSFASVAQGLGLGDFWIGGSKRPAITLLLQQTLNARPQLFVSLITAVVREGITYRNKQGNPLTREEVVALNGLLERLRLQVPELADMGFLGSLPNRKEKSAPVVSEAIRDAQNAMALARRLEELKNGFFQLWIMDDRQQAGLALERTLNETFRLFGLDPRSAFRVVGEQIDGSAVLDFETYLIEAKWTRHRTREDEMLVFRGKIEGKSAFTRGIFFSVNGFSDDALQAITKGKLPTFFLVDGFDLKTVLEGTVALPELLRYKMRHLAEEGVIFVRYPTTGSSYRDS